MNRLLSLGLLAALVVTAVVCAAAPTLDDSARVIAETRQNIKQIRRTSISAPISRPGEVPGKKMCYEFTPTRPTGRMAIWGDKKDTCAEAKRSAKDLCYHENLIVCSPGDCILVGGGSGDPCR